MSPVDIEKKPANGFPRCLGQEHILHPALDSVWRTMQSIGTARNDRVAGQCIGSRVLYAHDPRSR